MGTSDCYCAICGCSIIVQDERLERGSRSQKAQRIRKEVVETGLRQRAGKSTKNDDKHRYSDKNLEISDPEHSWNIQHSYDPEVMECRDTTLPNYHRFIDHVRVIMRDPDIEGSPMYFISGEAEIEQCCTGTVYEYHTSRPDPIEVDMYLAYGTMRGFPCHGLCLQILAKAVLGKPDSRLLNPEILYEIMSDERTCDSKSLKIDYGDISGQDQWWECMPGEEYTVINPLEFYDQHMRTLMSLTMEAQLNEEQTSQVGTCDLTTDPFHALSNELIHHITSYLRGKDVLSLRQASMIVRGSTSGNDFWKSRVHRDMPWLWIPPDLNQKADICAGESEKRPIDWLKVYRVFDSVTARPWGMKGKYMGLANRRRIWAACEQLRLLYMACVARSGQPLTNHDVGRCTWSKYDKIDTMWREALERLESSEQWTAC